MNYHDIENFIFLRLPAVPKALLDDEIRKAAKYFFEVGQPYTVDYDDMSIALVDAQTDYDFQDSTDWYFHKVIGVKYRETVLDKDDYVFERHNTIKLQFTPSIDVGDLLKVRAVMATDKVSVFPDAPANIWYDYGEGIAFRAMWSLSTMPARPWTGFEMAPFYENEYRKHLTESLNRANKFIRATPG